MVEKVKTEKSDPNRLLKLVEKPRLCGLSAVRSCIPAFEPLVDSSLLQETKTLLDKGNEALQEVEGNAAVEAVKGVVAAATSKTGAQSTKAKILAAKEIHALSKWQKVNEANSVYILDFRGKAFTTCQKASALLYAMETFSKNL